jgi:beta-glucanase (GH16 family)
MNLRLSFLARVALAGTLATLSSWSAQAAPPAGYKMVWQDEFETLSASDDQIKFHTKWTNHLWYRGGNGPHDLPDPSNLSVINGNLVLSTSKITDNQYSGGTISSVNEYGNGFYQRYGYWEIRGKFAKGSNLLSSLYMISQPHMVHPTNPPDPFEIDVIEYNSAGGSANYAATTVHWYLGQMHFDNSPENKTNTNVDLSTDYHVYGMEWTPNVIRFFFDGLLTKQTATPPDGHVPMAMIVALYLTGNGALADTPANARSYVDYVRVYAPLTD